MENTQILLFELHLVYTLNLHQLSIHIFSNSPLDNADILAASLSNSYCALFALILSSRILTYSVNVIFIKENLKSSF